MTRNPHVVSVCPKARNPHVVSDCQPSNPLAWNQPALILITQGSGTNAAINFKLREDVKHSVATGGIRTRVRIGVLTSSRPLAHHSVVSHILDTRCVNHISFFTNLIIYLEIS